MTLKRKNKWESEIIVEAERNPAVWYQLKLRNMYGFFHNWKHVKTSPNEALEILLVHWIQHLSLKNVQFSWLKKATVVALRLKIHNFKAWDGYWQSINTIAYLASVCMMNVALYMMIVWESGTSPCVICCLWLQTKNHYQSDGILLQFGAQQNLQHEGMLWWRKIKKVLLCLNSDSMNL